MARTRSVSIDGVTGKVDIDPISDQPTITTGASDDLILVSDTSDSGNMKKITIANAALTGPTGPAGGFTTNSDAQVNSLGVGTAGSTTAGEIRATNNITAFYSDERLKDVIGEIDNALDKVRALRGVYYTENAAAKDLGYDNNRRQVGVIAQDVEKVLPEAVREKTLDLLDGKTYKTVEYDSIHGLLINCIKELKKEIISLLLEGKNIELINSHIDKNYSSIINEISSNSNIQIISKNKKDNERKERRGQRTSKEKMKVNES